MMRRFVSAGAAVTAVALGACGDDGGDSETSAGAPPDIAVIGTDRLTFEPDAFEVHAGEETVLELTAESGLEHDVVIAGAASVGTVGEAGNNDDADSDAGDLHVVDAGAGRTASAAFAIDEPGTYEVYCSVPGHREAGMTAALTVSDA